MPDSNYNNNLPSELMISTKPNAGLVYLPTSLVDIQVAVGFCCISGSRCVRPRVSVRNPGIAGFGLLSRPLLRTVGTAALSYLL